MNCASPSTHAGPWPRPAPRAPAVASAPAPIRPRANRPIHLDRMDAAGVPGTKLALAAHLYQMDGVLAPYTWRTNAWRRISPRSGVRVAANLNVIGRGRDWSAPPDSGAGVNSVWPGQRTDKRRQAPTTPADWHNVPGPGITVPQAIPRLPRRSCRRPGCGRWCSPSGAGTSGRWPRDVRIGTGSQWARPCPPAVEPGWPAIRRN